MSNFFKVLVFGFLTFCFKSLTAFSADSDALNLKDILSHLQTLEDGLQSPSHCFAGLPVVKAVTVSKDALPSDLDRERALLLQRLVNLDEEMMQKLKDHYSKLDALEETSDRLKHAADDLKILRDRAEKSKQNLSTAEDDSEFLRTFEAHAIELYAQEKTQNSERAQLQKFTFENPEVSRVQLRRMLIQHDIRGSKFQILSKLDAGQREVFSNYLFTRNKTSFDKVLEQVDSLLSASASTSQIFLSEYRRGLQNLKNAQNLADQMEKIDAELRSIAASIEKIRSRVQLLLGTSERELFHPFIANSKEKKLVEIAQLKTSLERELEDVEKARADFSASHNGISNDLSVLEVEKTRLQREGDEIENSVAALWSKFESERGQLVEQANKFQTKITLFHDTHPIYPNLIQIKDLSLLTKTQREIWNQWQSGLGIDFGLITQGFVEAELKLFCAKNPAQTDASIKFAESMLKICEKQSLQSSVFEVKAITDKRLEEVHSKKSKYNIAFSNAADPILVGKRQCLSGAKCLHLVLRNIWGASKYKNENAVMVMVPGHILVGQMKPDAEKDWNLIGVETTVEGDGVAFFGKARDLKGAIRVVDPELYFLREIFKDVAVDLKPISSAMLQVPSEQYGIDLSKFKYEGPHGGESDDPLAFGKANMPEGDLPIASADRIDAQQLLEGHIVSAPNTVTSAIEKDVLRKSGLYSSSKNISVESIKSEIAALEAALKKFDERYDEPSAYGVYLFAILSGNFEKYYTEAIHASESDSFDFEQAQIGQTKNELEKSMARFNLIKADASLFSSFKEVFQQSLSKIKLAELQKHFDSEIVRLVKETFGVGEEENHDLPR
jgi:hypothetical protein